MYGLLLESAESFVVERYGKAIWLEAKERAGIKKQSFATHGQYSDNIIPQLTSLLHNITGDSLKNIGEGLGKRFVHFISRYGYDRILKVLGRHLRDFINGLDNLHEYMRFTYPKLKAPSFFCTDETENGMKLHYRSKRQGFLYYVMGQVKEVGRVFYNQDVEMEVLFTHCDQNTGEGSYVIYQLSFDNRAYIASRKRPKRNSVLSTGSEHDNLKIQMDVFYEVFPFHIIFDKDMVITSIGSSLHAICSSLIGESIESHFLVLRPFIQFSWENVGIYIYIYYILIIFVLHKYFVWPGMRMTRCWLMHARF